MVIHMNLGESTDEEVFAEHTCREVLKDGTK